MFQAFNLFINDVRKDIMILSAEQGQNINFQHVIEQPRKRRKKKRLASIDC